MQALCCYYCCCFRVGAVVGGCKGERRVSKGGVESTCNHTGTERTKEKEKKVSFFTSLNIRGFWRLRQ